MLYVFRRPLGPPFFLLIGLLVLGIVPARAQAPDFLNDPGNWRLVMSPYTQHFHYSPEHKPVWALGAERQLDDGQLVGAAYFRNSFGQPSGYVYYGHRYVGLLGGPRLIAQWSAGIIYGYRGPYQNKVPFNVEGFAPGALVSAGWQFSKQFSGEVHLLGNAGVMFQLSYELR